MAGPVRNGSPFNAPSHFFEFNGTTLTQVADLPNAAAFIAYQGRMVLLPSGQILLSVYNQGATQDVLLYSNGGAPQDAWRPVITTAPSQAVPGNTYSISGTLFNGFSEGASYGDDAQSSTNYPMVRIRNQATGHVCYARTHNHSRMGVEAVGSATVVTTQFDVPLGLEPGVSDLVVVVNGIPSLPTIINQLLPTTLSYTGDTLIPNGGTATMRAVLRATASSLPIAGRTVHFTLGSGGSAQTCSGVTSGTATCPISPVAQPLGPGVVAASFAGDASYLPSSTSANTLIFEVLLNGGFVVGDLSESVGASVTFSGAQWPYDNALSGMDGPASFLLTERRKSSSSTIGWKPCAWSRMSGVSSRSGCASCSPSATNFFSIGNAFDDHCLASGRSVAGVQVPAKFARHLAFTRNHRASPATRNRFRVRFMGSPVARARARTANRTLAARIAQKRRIGVLEGKAWLLPVFDSLLESIGDRPIDEVSPFHIGRWKQYRADANGATPVVTEAKNVSARLQESQLP